MVCLLGLLSLLAISLQRVYADVSLKELKHRARHGDDIAVSLIKAVGYGHSLRAVLWVIIGATTAGFFVYVSQHTPVWLAFSASMVLIWVGFVWLPATRVSKFSRKIAAVLAPMFGKLLGWVNPLVDRVTWLIRRFRPLHVHTGLYDKYDLLDLLERQQVQPENRIEASELNIAMHALRMSEVLVRDRMVPRRKIRMVSLHDSLGPIVLDELHASGFSRFPVFDGKQDNIVGTLYLKDLVNARGSSVTTLMRKEVYYLHEDQTMHDGLQAVLKTHHHLFMVVNEFEEITGIISSEDVFESIIGTAIKDEFDAYDNIRAVAATEARQTHEERTESDAEPVTEEPAEELQEDESPEKFEEPENEEEVIELDAEQLLKESTTHEARDNGIETIELDK